ncbi:asporin isoform X2 [Protopterus annectens]|uniref:asporin isoform X2 n=1 Tax=Protopterus annectens TaxID=7888 RepID=UPI001CFBD899|nr:asporin isoform X2 [Protopterus annectens]
MVVGSNAHEDTMKEFLLIFFFGFCSAYPYWTNSFKDFMLTKNIMLQDMDDSNSLLPVKRLPRQQPTAFVPQLRTTYSPRVRTTSSPRVRTTPSSPRGRTTPRLHPNALPPPFVYSVCPFGCQCFMRVVQCSDLGLTSVPENIPPDTLMIDLQNNKITEIKENDFKGLKSLYALFLLNNRISKIHPKAFQSTKKLQLVYLSHNRLTQIPSNLPKSLAEFRIHDNKIKKVQKEAFKGMKALHVLEMSANPLESDGIEDGAFEAATIYYIRIAEAKLKSVPKELPNTLLELHLDHNKIENVELEDFMRYKGLYRLGLGYNKIKEVENGSLAHLQHIKEIHLENNKLSKVPVGLGQLKYLQVVYLHDNNIASVGVNDFCPAGSRIKKTFYNGITLYNNPVKHWQIEPSTFRCMGNGQGLHIGNFKK